MRYRLRELELDTDRYALRGRCGERVLGPRLFRALLLLAHHGEQVVTKEELLAEVWEGDRVSDAALQQTIRQLRRALTEVGGARDWIASVYGRGYRLEARLDAVPGEVPPASLLWSRPSVAVLPASLAEDATDGETARLVDGLAEDLTHRLASFRTFPVLAHGTMHAWRRRGGTLEELRRHGVRYAVHLTARSDTRRVRVAAELIALEDGMLCAREACERPFRGLFEAMDEIAGLLAVRTWPHVGRAESERAMRRDPTQRSAWEAFVAGVHHLWSYTPRDNAVARRELARSHEADPRFAAPLAFLALAHLNDAHAGWSRDGAASVRLALDASRTAVQLDPRDPLAHGVRGGLAVVVGDRASALRAFRRALCDNPSLASAHWGLGRGLTVWGRAREALEHFDAALRLSPEDPLCAHFHEGAAFAHFALGEPAAAVECARRSLALEAGWPRSYHVLAAGLVELGERQEARRALARARALGDRSDLAAVRRSHELAATEPGFLARYLEALAAAGLDRASGGMP